MNNENFKPNLQYALYFLFLAFAFTFCLFVHSFIDNYVSCHVFLVSSGVRQLLLGQQKRKQCAKRQTGKRQKQETESKEHIVDEPFIQIAVKVLQWKSFHFQDPSIFVNKRIL